jgi:hypothetical protein
LARPPAGKGVPELPLPVVGSGPEKEPEKERLVSVGAAMWCEGGAGFGARVKDEVEDKDGRNAT